MAQQVVIAGAMFNDVPAISVPDANNVFHSFLDTTIASNAAGASDIANGKKAYVNGSLITGTASGGASNFVQGTFTTGSTRNSVETITLNYSGSGYPIAYIIYVDGGAYNDTSAGNTTWYNSVNRYDVGVVSMTKNRTTSAPVYTGQSSDDYGNITIIYKNSTSYSTTYTTAFSMTAQAFVSASMNPTGSYNCVKFKGNGKTLAYLIGNLTSNSRGLAPSTKYAYIVIYSS